MADYLTTSGINSLVDSYKTQQTTLLMDPLTKNQTKYQNLSDAWGELKTKISTLQSVSSDLKSVLSDSTFNSKIASTSNSSYVSATVSNTAAPSNYTLRVNQLAKSDLVVSNNMASDAAVSSMVGTHTIRVGSGDYYAMVDVALTGSETNKTVMQKAADAINSNKAVLKSTGMAADATFTGAGTFQIDLNDTTTSINYDYSSGKNYSDIINDVASKINSAISGVTAERVVNSDNTVSLKVTVNNTAQYISLQSANDTGGLFGSSNLNVDVTKLKSAKALVSASNFTPASGYNKFSLTAVNSGYDNRLQLSDVNGSFLNYVGLTSSVLNSRTHTTGDTDAGFIYTANSALDNQLSSKIVFNGINIQSDSNNIDTLANGVVFNLNATMASSDNDVTVSVQTDTSTIKNKVQSFVTAYNDVYNYMKMRDTSGTDGRGLFAGDSTVSAFLRTLTSIGMSNVSGLPTGNLQNLSQIGLTFDPDTGLTLSDSTKLTNALSDDSTQVAALFNTTNGIGTRLYTETSRYIGANGVITQLQDSYSTNLKYIQDKITSTQGRIDKGADTLRNEYIQLQQQLSNFYAAQGMYMNYSSSSS